jgi:hypothetical protein
MMRRETGVPVDRVIADWLSAANILRDVLAALNDRALQALPGPRSATILGENSTQRRMGASVAALLPRLEGPECIPGFRRLSTAFDGAGTQPPSRSYPAKECRSSDGGNGRPAGAVRRKLTRARQCCTRAADSAEQCRPHIHMRRGYEHQSRQDDRRWS